MVELRIGDAPVEFLAFEEFEERVLAGRVPDTAQIRFAPVTGDRFVPAGDLDLVTSLRNAERVAWRDRFNRSGPPILTVLLVGLQIRIWCAAQVPGLGGWLASSGMNWMPPELEDGEVWRIFTSGLLHTDFLHVLLNMVWMTYTGWNLERALGRANLAAIFFFSVFLGSMLSMIMTPANPSLGASGGVYGLVAASVVFGFIRQDILPEKGRNLFGAALAPYLILMFFSGLSDARTDNWAHFGGILAGSTLAFVLDPPGFERGRRNLFVQIGGTAAMLGTLVFLALAGPHIHPLVDQEQARLDALPRTARTKPLPLKDLLTDLSYSVPAGWKPGVDAGGQMAFRSPAGPDDDDRSIAVWLKTSQHPQTLRQQVDRWKARFDSSEPDAVFIEEEAEWFGRAARRVTADLANGERLEFLGTVRGMVGIQRVNGGAIDTRARLAPLFARIDDAIDWEEPLALQAARRSAFATPKGVKARTDLALELARWGQVEEALRIQRELIAERPAEPERWEGLLQITTWYRPEEVVAIADQAVGMEPMLPSLITTVAHGLRKTDERAADGLLQLAWNRVPGDRDLKRALRREGQRFVLTPDGLPHQLVWAGSTRRDPAEVERVVALPLSVANAHAWTAQLTADRQELAAGFDPDASDSVQQLLTLRDGGFVPYYKEQKKLLRDLASVEGGRQPRWVSDVLAESLQREGVVEGLRLRIKVPQGPN